MNAVEPLETLLASWRKARQDDEESSAADVFRKLHDSLIQHTSIKIPLALVGSDGAREHGFVEYVTLWFIDAEPNAEDCEHGKALQTKILPLHQLEEVEGITDAIREAVAEALHLYNARVGGDVKRHIAAVVFVVGDISGEQDRSDGRLDGRSGQAGVVFATLSWLADRAPPAVICFGPCDPTKFSTDNVREKILLAAQGEWDRCVLPAAAVDAALIASLGTIGWARQGGDQGEALVNSESGLQIVLNTYETSQHLFDRWYALSEFPASADLGYRPPTGFDRTQEPTYGALWRAALEVGPSDRRVAVPAYKIESLLRNLHYAGVGTETWSLTSLQQIAWQNLIAATPEANTNPFDASNHLIVAGPTSCGKTTLAEVLMISAALQGRNQRSVLYIAPTKALAQTFHRNLVACYSQAGIMGDEASRAIILSTGEDVADDWRFRRGAFSIACLVYEKANVLASTAPDLLSSLAMVVVDEAHMVTEDERGPILDSFLAKVQEERQRRERAHSADDPLRVVAISTETADGQPDPNLVKMLTYNDLTIYKDVEPLSLCTSARPVPVTHTLVIESKDRSLGPYRLVDIKAFGENDNRILTQAELGQLERKVSGLEFMVRASTDARFQQQGGGQREIQDRVRALIEDIIHESPRGRRILVFMSSKHAIYEFAGQLQKQLSGFHRVQTLDDDAPFAGLEEDIEDEVVLKDIQRWAGRGILVHHGSLDPRLRQRVVNICANEPASATEIVLATETLSFGVNLWITDVILLGTTFYTAARNRGEAGSSKPLDTYEFHNMVGRAGRLSKSSGEHPPRVYILPRSGISPVVEVVQRYYVSVAPIESKIFLNPDKALLRESAFEEIRAEAFGHPFLRAVLDGLRHVAFVSGHGRAKDVQSVGVTLQELMRFFEGTLFGRTKNALRTSRANGVETQPGVEERAFRDCVKLMLQACAHLGEGTAGRPPLRLVQELSGEPVRYAITEEGEAIIDTGVEVRTIVPLLNLVEEIRGVWDSSDFAHLAFPTELYILCIIAQFEGHTSVIDELPEFQGNDSKWTTFYQMRNTKLVLSDLTVNLAKILGAQNIGEDIAPIAVETLSRSLREKIAQHPTVRELRQRRSSKAQYDLGAADSFIRLFNATCAWIVAGTHPEIRKHLQSVPQNLNIQARFTKPLGDYAEFLSWKVDCLTRLLAARMGENEASGLDADAEEAGDSSKRVTRRRARLAEQVSLRNLVWRLRLGCPIEGVPALIRRHGEIRRTDIAKVLERGLTLSSILSAQDALSAVPELSSATKAALRQEYQSYTINQFRGLSEAFCSGALSDPKPSEQAAVGLWSALSGKVFPTAVEQFRLPTRGQSIARDVWTALSEPFENEPREDESDRLSVTLSSQSEEGQTRTVSLEWEADENPGLLLAVDVISRQAGRVERSRDRCVKILFLGARSDTKVQMEFNQWQGLDEILLRERADRDLVIVPAPWLPEALQSNFVQLAAQHSASHQRAIYVWSLAAFASTVSSLARGFLRPSDFIDNALGVAAPRMFGASALLDALENTPQMPNALVDALMRYVHVEVGGPVAPLPTSTPNL